VSKYKLKKRNLGALGLAASMVVTLSACSSDYEDYKVAPDVSIVQQEVLEVTDEIKKTSDYYLIRLGDNIYLAMASIGRDSKNTITDYYDVKTGEFIGKVLNVSYYNRARNEFSRYDRDDEAHTIVPDYNLEDYNYYNGEYGLGKLLPETAIINLSDFLNTKYPSNADLEYYSSNSASLHALIDSKVYTDYVKNCYSYDFMHGAICYSFLSVPGIGYKENSYTLNNKLTKFICSNVDAEEIFIGYRLSISEKDNGYNYIYDILTGNIVYIGKSREDAYSEVIEEAYDSGLTLKGLKKQYGFDGDIEISAEDDKTIENETLTQKLDVVDNEDLKVKEEEMALPEEEYKIKAEDLYIVDTTSESVISKSDGCGRYYFFSYVDVNYEYSKPVYSYRDLYNEYASLSLCGNSVSYLCSYGESIFFQVSDYDFENNVYFDDFAFKPINKFLEQQGLGDLIKDVYTQEEYDAIYNYLETNNLELRK